ncbi:copine-9-like [Contarinia nasturtii]|uniref:copine-9-like n=1 Tax=Contarinia nasturtii TaxID=265458 RepID=UPI0012D3A925|nr:copine-9-like [Contarinia nasturtii]
MVGSVAAVVFSLQQERRTRKKGPHKSYNDTLEYLTNEQLALFLEERYKSNLPTSRIELSISCKNLMCTNVIKNRSDPYCVVLLKRGWQKHYQEIGRTECMGNTRNPNFRCKIVVDYNFEIVQNIQFVIRDRSLRGYLGLYETTMSELVSCYAMQITRQLCAKVDGNLYPNRGEITVVAEEATSCKQMAEIEFRAQNLPRSWFRKNKPFLLISRSNEDGSYSVVTNTEPSQTSCRDPVWQKFSIDIATLCNADFDRSFKIDCYNFRDNDNHKLIGTCYASLHNLRKMCQNKESRTLVNEKRQKTKPSYVPTGALKVEKIEITEDVTFVDFIRHGTEMHFAVAIDFTASNGNFTDPKSLHYLCNERMNYYEIALKGIGGIISKYSNTPLFPAFGFGAKLPPYDHVSFQFPLNGNSSHPYCCGIDEILMHYRDQLNVVELFGPTNFAPVIHDTIEIAQKLQDGKHYFVLLILTDGAISDMRKTKHAIIDASKLPISIIIVGVGDANFEAMEELDSDNVRLSVDGLFAERDIVQFVPLNNFLSKDGEFIESQFKLAEEVLAEIPEQVTSYMTWRGFKPEIVPNIPTDSATVVPTAPMAKDCYV